jgi:hypothetical protein
MYSAVSTASRYVEIKASRQAGTIFVWPKKARSPSHEDSVASMQYADG